ncbi:MAG: glycosyl hydrolase, partial [Gaiellales bacterium]
MHDRSTLSRRRLLEIAGAGALGVTWLGRVSAGLDQARAAGVARSPAIIRSYGGLVIPATGAYFGADDSHGFTSPNGIETQLGRVMAIRNRHRNWNAGRFTYPLDTLRADVAAGAVPMISQQGAGNFPCTSAPPHGGDRAVVNGQTGMQRIVAGEYDAQFRAQFAALRSLGAPVIYRLFMEMNGAHNPYYYRWQGGGAAGQAAFREAWIHIWTLARSAGATLDAGGNVIFCFCPQSKSSGAAGEWGLLYPGDPYVDFIGVDNYRDTFEDGCDNPAAGRGFYGFAQQHGKPFMICESGFQQGAVVKVDGVDYDKDGSRTGRSLIAEHQAAIRDRYPDCVAFCHWNGIGPIGNDLVDTSAASLAQYRAWAHDPWFGLTLASSRLQTRPPATLTRVAASPVGRARETHIGFTLSRPAAVTVVIRDAKNRAVR